MILALALLAGGQAAPLAAAPPAAVAAEAAAQAMPMTGPRVPGMASFDRIIPALMRKYRVPGGAVAVARDGRLVLARGYGLADRDAQQPVQPDSLFRLASLSKPITAVAVLALVDAGRLDLDAPAFRALGAAAADPRLGRVTVRELLQHTGGWDPEDSHVLDPPGQYDPMFDSREIARAMGAPAPASCPTIIRFMTGKPLDFDPGTQYAYSNFGYCVLGRVIEGVTGQSYADSVAASVLQPAGISRMRLGHTRLEERADGEVRYYDYPGAARVQSVFPDGRGLVPAPYGGFYLEAMDAHGGWLASAIDYLRFITALDGRRGPPLLRPETVRQMVARPAPPVSVGTDTYYGLGWSIRPVGDDANWWHTGALDGTSTIAVRAAGGLAWVALFNSWPKDRDAWADELDAQLWQAVDGVTEWPSHDLFDQFP